MLRNWSGWGGGMITFLALVHMLNATQLVWVGWGDDSVPCTCTHIMTDGCKAWASACKARKLNHRAVNLAKMQFVKKDMKHAKGQSKLLGAQKIDRLWQDLKGFLGRSVSSKNNAREVNPRLKTFVYAYMFWRNADNIWHETGQLCKWWATKEKSAQISRLSTKMDAALQRNADFDSKPCVLQHFGFPPFDSITSKYCKGYKFHKKEDFKMLKNRGVVPGPVTLLFAGWSCGVFSVFLR